MSAPTEDSLIAFIALFGKSKIKIENQYKISLKEEVKIEEMPEGAVLTPDEHKEFLFFVIPSPSWNGIQKELTRLIPSLNIAGVSFKIPVADIILGPQDESWFRAMMKLDSRLKDPYTFENEIRWGDSVDENEYPFIVLTQTAWNAFQRKIDEHKIRDLIKHRVRPIAQKIPKKAVFKVSRESFDKWKKDGFKA